MATRKPRLSKLKEQKESNVRGRRHAFPQPGKFSRAYFEGPDSTLRGQVRESAPFMNIYRDHIIAPQLRVARKNGLEPRAYAEFHKQLIELANRYHTIPLDENGEPILRTNPQTREMDIVGVKRLRGRPNYFRDIKIWGRDLQAVRSKMVDLSKKYPGIDFLRQLEDRRVPLSNEEIINLSKLPFFKLGKVEKHRLHDEYASLELAEHELINRIQNATISAREETQTKRKLKK